MKCFQLLIFLYFIFFIYNRHNTCATIFVYFPYCSWLSRWLKWWSVERRYFFCIINLLCWCVLRINTPWGRMSDFIFIVTKRSNIYCFKHFYLKCMSNQSQQTTIYRCDVTVFVSQSKHFCHPRFCCKYMWFYVCFKCKK